MSFISFLAYACIFALFEVNYAQFIPPTMSDIDTEYYNISNASGEYLLCSGNKANCKIQCITDHACQQTIINATLAQHLVLECGQSDACIGITVYGPSTSADVQCLSYYACYNALFEFDGTNSVNIHCNATSGSSCRSIAVNVVNNQDLNVHCGGLKSCRSIEVSTNSSNSVAISCDGESSCIGSEFFVTAVDVIIDCNGFQACDGIWCFANLAAFFAYLDSQNDEYYCDPAQPTNCCPFAWRTKTPTISPTANPIFARITTTMDAIQSTSVNQLTTSIAQEVSTTLGLIQSTEIETTTIVAESTKVLQSTTEEPLQAADTTATNSASYVSLYVLLLCPIIFCL